jgi:rhodanese-related sulfurtransferase
MVARWRSTLSLNQKLGLLGFVLGLLAVFANVAPARTTRVHEKDLLTTVARGEDSVTPGEVAAWIVAGRADYRLVDVRGAAAFDEYHIPTAENVPLPAVADGALGRTDNVVLYGDGSLHAAQAWMVLEGRGYTSVRMLRGGIGGWKDEVLFPVRPPSPTPEEAARFERSVQLAKFFGGQARAAAAPGGADTALPVATPAMPSVPPPTLPGGGAAAAPRKKKEGC